MAIKQYNMRAFVIILIASCFLFIYNIPVRSQNTDSTIVTDALAQEEFLLPLHVLIESAKINSPILKLHDAEIVIREMKKRSLKKDWSKYISFGASMQYGTFDSYISNSLTDGISPVGSISTGQQTRYSLGLSVNLPLYAIYNRRNKINIGQKEVEQAYFEKEQVINELKQLIIIEYNNLILSRKMLVLRNNNVHSIDLQVAMGENQFKNGQIDLSELATIRGIQVKANIDLEKEKTNFHTAFMMLEETCGVSLISR